MTGRVHHGGVMRCCASCFHGLDDEELEAMPPGTVLRCKYCEEGLQKREDGDWEKWWNPPREERPDD